MDDIFDKEIERLKKLKEDEKLVTKGIDIIAVDKSLFCKKYRKDTTDRNYYKDGKTRIDGPGVYLHSTCSPKCPIYKHYNVSCLLVQERADVRDRIRTAIEKESDILLKNIIDEEIRFIERIKNEQNNKNSGN